MANVLKKLGAFVPTMEDTVGNLEATPAPVQAKPAIITAVAPNVTKPVPAMMAPAPVQITASPNPTVQADAEIKPAAKVDTDRAEATSAFSRTRKARRAADDRPDRLSTREGSVDMRYMRRTNRTAMFSIKVRPELIDEMKQRALEDGITLGELMDDMWEAHQDRTQRRPRRGAE